VLLEEQAFPFEEKAIQLHQVNTARAKEGTYDEWVQKSFAALHNSTRGVTPRWKSVSSKSTRFVSAAAALALLAGCHGSPPRRPAPAPSSPPASSPRRRVPQPPLRPARARLRPERAARPRPAQAPSGRAPGPRRRRPGRPVPERAAQQYAQALNMMKSGRNSDAELEFKQLALAYPDYAGPYVNLGLLYVRASRFGDARRPSSRAEAQSRRRGRQ